MATERTEYVAGLRALADLLERHPELQLPANEVHWHFLSGPNPKADLAQFARLIGGEIAKGTYGDDSSKYGSYFELRGQLEGLNVSASAYRDSVCTRVVKGVREVTKTVPAPGVPMVEVTETVEDVEWVCAPLLSRDEQMAEAANDGFLDNYDPAIDAPGADDYLADAL